MSSRHISLLLDDMLDSVLAINQYVQGLTESSFRANRLVQDAVIRRFEILGEAANLIPDDYRLKHSEIPWGVMAGMRNRLIHGYFLVDLDILWRTVQTDIPPLETPLTLLRQQQP